MKILIPISIILMLSFTSFFGVGTQIFELNNLNNSSTELIIDGPILCQVGIEYYYTIYLIDPEGDIVWYRIDFGDGEWTDWIGPYDSIEKIVFRMSWPTCGVYSFRAEVKCNDTTYNASLQITVINDNIIYVDDDNIDGPWNGTFEYPYKLIQDGIKNATNGDTVYVYDGIYFENLVVDKSINLLGKDRTITVIDGSGIVDVINITTDYVNISGFTIQHSGNNHGDSGIKTGFFHFNVNITDNNIFHNNFGIYLSKSLNDLIEGNNISYNEFGIWSLGSSVTIYDNTIYTNLWRGIYLNGDENSITNNIMTGNLSDSEGDLGLEIEGNYNIFSNNTIENCNEAININKANNNQIISNSISNNQRLIFSYFSNGNLIAQNNFINNEVPGERPTFVNSLFDSNKWSSNYWGKARIFPYFIFGEIWIFKNFYIKWLNIDWYPAKAPYDIIT